MYCITHRIQLDTFKSLWNSISSIIAVHKKIDELKGFLPNYDDLRGAVTALLRLQDTYQLDTNQLAQGRIRSMMAKQMSGMLLLNILWPPIVKLLYLLHFTSMDILKCNRPHLMIKNSYGYIFFRVHLYYLSSLLFKNNDVEFSPKDVLHGKLSFKGLNALLAV